MTLHPALESDASDEPYHWDLTRLYAAPDDPRIEQDLEGARKLAKSLKAAYAGQVAALPPAELRLLLDRCDHLAATLARLFGYAYLLFSADTQPEANKNLYARIQGELPDIRQEAVFVELELQRMPDEAFARLQADPALSVYRDHLGRLRRLAAHALDESSEKILAMKDVTSGQAWTQLYFETTADLRVRLNLPGHPEEMTISQAYAIREIGAREEREAAYNETLRLHAQQARVLTFVYNALFENWRHNIALRGYAHPLAPLCVEEDLAPEALEVLLDAVESQHALVQRYFRAKARLLGLPVVMGHDIRAVIPGSSTFISFDEGRDIVLDSFSSFSEDMGNVARGFFDDRYIDAFSRTGKRAGAYCLSAGPVFHPYLFLNYNFTLKDVIVMAHEMGHGVHNVIGGRHHNITNADRMTLFMETPSTFAETLTFERLLALEVRPGVRQALLGSQIESAILKIFKAVALTRFQLVAYARRHAGHLAAAAYCQIWEDRIAAMYGDSVQLGAWDRWEWVTFHHVLSHPFYDYAYAFGQLLVYALLRQHRAEGRAFVPKYLSLLEAGTSLPIGALLAKVDLDPRRPTLWLEGLAYVEELISEFEASVTP
ncbi:MAG: M3 family metallopeptidase [Candidatus Sericytochromatia bacterium]|nr:M3 family metallopeptidase [Candidatus Sericytochromatia bacterium]